MSGSCVVTPAAVGQKYSQDSDLFWGGVSSPQMSCKIIKIFSLSLFITVSLDSLSFLGYYPVAVFGGYTQLFTLFIVLWEEIPVYSHDFCGIDRDRLISQ